MTDCTGLTYQDIIFLEGPSSVVNVRPYCRNERDRVDNNGVSGGFPVAFDGRDVVIEGIADEPILAVMSEVDSEFSILITVIAANINGKHPQHRVNG
jgi:hypothetical protein